MFKKLFLSAILAGAGAVAFGQTATISPSNGNRGQSLPLVISGQNTNFTSQGSASIYLMQGSYVLGQGSSTAFTSISVIDPTTIMANLHIPGNAPTGAYDLYLNAGTFVVQNQAFTVNPAANANISLQPNGSKPGVTTNVTITVPGGSFKTQAQVIEKVWLTRGTGIIADINNITVVNSTTFTADVVVPSGAAIGYWNANIYTDDEIIYTTPNAFLIDPTFSVHELQAVNFSLYPNPANDYLVLEYEISSNSKFEVQVIDLSGKNITNAIRFQHNSGNSVKADITHLTDGAYMIKMIVNGEVVATRKFVKE